MMGINVCFDNGFYTRGLLSPLNVAARTLSACNNPEAVDQPASSIAHSCIRKQNKSKPL